MTASEKQRLRAEIRAHRPAADVQRAESEAICRHVKSWSVWREAQVVAAYLPLPWEADVTPLLEDALRSGKTLALPRIEGKHSMTMRLVSHPDELVRGSYGLLEPPADAPVAPAECIELILVPLEAVDRCGMRLGKGGGYYDAMLASLRCMTAGIALSYQLVDKVPCEAHDVPLHAVISRDGICLLTDGKDE